MLSQCHGGCSEVDSLTEAVAGEGFSLKCISCKKREEVSARATVDWHFKPLGEKQYWHIFHYDHPRAETIHEQFNGRMEWQGTKKSDIQSGTIYIHNMTFNDTGTYRCTFQRTIFLVQNDVHHIVEKHVELSVVKVANREITSLISELMMYVLILVLQLWLILVLVSCYKKISNEYEAREAKLAPMSLTP
ncbi:sodium channel subunit beta-1-like isoform X2 [Cynoglossus semilaevis]|uniref:sodium channel subunit beta-1-like isoform X2 n=1 Tax=Cynoglossus semilaevis TaxID=244447 RepID=UPI0007DC9401|nr:sodium channel subunit beta-1-like isoform X2 [Cynoglossus semilaevis]